MIESDSKFDLEPTEKNVKYIMIGLLLSEMCMYPWMYQSLFYSPGPPMAKSKLSWVNSIYQYPHMKYNTVIMQPCKTPVPAPVLYNQMVCFPDYVSEYRAMSRVLFDGELHNSSLKKV